MKITRDNARGKWKIPKPLRVTDPAVLERSDAEQRERAKRLNSPFLAHSPAERERERAGRAVELLAERLALVTKKMGKVFTAGGAENFEELREAQKSIWRQLAESYAVLGRFDLASHLEYDPDLKLRYQRVWRAVWRRDESFCGHGDAAQYVVQDIFSVKHRAERPLLACTECLCMNVADVPAHVAAARGHRRTAAALVGGMKPDEARDVLARRRHTTGDLLK